MFQWFRDMMGGSASQPAGPAPVNMAAYTPPPPPPPAEAPPELPFNLVGAANGALGAGLSAASVKRRMINRETGRESWLAVKMPVASVSIQGPQPDKRTNGMNYMIGGDAHEPICITVTLQDAVGNYDLESLNQALHGIIGAIPTLKGKLEFAKPLAVDKMDHADVWKQLEPLLTASGKFSAQEMGLLTEYFETHKNLPTEQPDWSHLHVAHAEGKVQIKIRPAELPGDDKVNMSGEVRMVKYFEESKDKILAKMREKIGNFMTPEQLAALDFTVGIKKGDWGDMPTIEFGSKPVPPETALGTTTLADFDTDKITACFKETLMEADKEIPHIFGRIADGDMVRHLVQHRLGKTPALEAALNHPMFNSQAEQAVHTKEMEKKDIIPVANIAETDKPNELFLRFDLPHGMNLEALRQNIVQHAGAIAQGPASPTQGIAAA